METVSDAFARLARELDSATRIGYPLAELNDLLTAASGQDVLQLPVPHVRDAYRLNYITAMVELAAHRTGVAAFVGVRRCAASGACLYRQFIRSACAPAYGVATTIQEAEYLHRFEPRRSGLMFTGPTGEFVKRCGEGFL